MYVAGVVVLVRSVHWILLRHEVLLRGQKGLGRTPGRTGNGWQVATDRRRSSEGESAGDRLIYLYRLYVCRGWRAAVGVGMSKRPLRR